jgi:hypothetical protein
VRPLPVGFEDGERAGGRREHDGGQQDEPAGDRYPVRGRHGQLHLEGPVTADHSDGGEPGGDREQIAE